MDPTLLLKRLDEIAHSLEKSGHALALIGCGSVGLELERLDSYSDLDFFAVVEPGYKQAYLDDLGWLSNLCPIAYCFANTRDGYKLLFTDGIFCEFAVFVPEDMRGVPFAPGRVIWKQPHVPANISQPVIAPGMQGWHDPDWLLGEALTNLYVGLARDQRGEKLSAMRFIQGYALDRVIELAGAVESAAPAAEDLFAKERRFEQRYPGTARQLAAFAQGYAHNRESALAILNFLEQNFRVNREMATAIRDLSA